VTDVAHRPDFSEISPDLQMEQWFKVHVETDDAFHQLEVRATQGNVDQTLIDSLNAPYVGTWQYELQPDGNREPITKGSVWGICSLSSVVIASIPIGIKSYQGVDRINKLSGIDDAVIWRGCSVKPRLQ
jgi:hypothetical protein